MRLCPTVIALLATLMGFTAQAYAGKFVEFESGGVESNRVQLVGYLARPQGSGPFPAVVVLHGCGGFHQDMLAWADRLRRWGYVAWQWTVLVLAELRRRAVTLLISPQTRSKRSHT